MSDGNTSSYSIYNDKKETLSNGVNKSKFKIFAPNTSDTNIVTSDVKRKILSQVSNNVYFW